MKRFVAALMSAIAFGLAIATPEKRDIIITTDGVPFKIETLAVLIDAKDDITVSVIVENTSKETIEALEVGIVFYDYFNEYIYGFRGFSKLLDAKTELKAGAKTFVTFQPRFLRNNYVLTTTAFATKARFSGGKIWTANLDDVAKKIKSLTGVSFERKQIEP